MRITIRSKLIFAISALVMVLFASAAYLFINEKKTEMANDIYSNALAFSKLTANTISDDYDLYLAQNSFVYFNREINSIFAKNDDVSVIKLVSYNGEVLYDSGEDVDKRYEGDVRSVDDIMLEQIRSENISVLTADGRVIYIKSLDDGGVKFVDKNEVEVLAPEAGTLIEYFVVPANEKYSVVYNIDYHNLEERVANMIERIIYLALFGVMLGMIMSFLMSAQVTRPIAALVDAAGRLATGDFKTRVEIKTRDEMNFLGGAFNKMAEDLEKSVENKLYKERVGRELELATQIQKQLIPAKLPALSGVDIAAGLVPAEEIGGDIYDFIPVGEGRMLMYLGDVTGHGVPAGIVSSIASALFYGYSTVGDLREILIGVNRVLKVKTMPTMFMTLCLMAWDSVARKFSYANAGHEQIIHYKAATGKVELTPAGGIALGMLPDISKQTVEHEIELASGDFLVIYSDGIPEAWQSEKEKYGIDRFKAVVEKAGSGTAEEIKTAILSDVKMFANGHKQEDDITLIVFKKL